MDASMFGVPGEVSCSAKRTSSSHLRLPQLHLAEFGVEEQPAPVPNVTFDSCNGHGPGLWVVSSVGDFNIDGALI